MKNVMRFNAIAVAKKYNPNILGEQLNSIMLSTLNKPFSYQIVLSSDLSIK